MALENFSFVDFDIVDQMHHQMRSKVIKQSQARLESLLQAETVKLSAEKWHQKSISENSTCKHVATMAIAQELSQQEMLENERDNEDARALQQVAQEMRLCENLKAAFPDTDCSKSLTNSPRGSQSPRTASAIQTPFWSSFFP